MWTTPDPIGVLGGVNLYGYVHNNPVNRLDFIGLAGYCGSGKNEPFVPESPGGYPFSDPCKKHDECYEDQKGFDYCNKQFGLDMDVVCNNYESVAPTPPGWENNPEHHDQVNWGKSYEECKRFSSLYEAAVNAFGASAYNNAVNKTSGSFGFSDAIGAIGDAVGAIGDAIGDAVGAIGDAIGGAVGAIGDATGLW